MSASTVGATSILFAAAGDGGEISVSSDDASSGSSVEVDLVPDSSLPKQIRIDIPAGYALDLSGKPGDELGDATISLIGLQGPSFATGYGTLVVEDPATPLGACSPGHHDAVWRFAASLAGRQLAVMIGIARGDGERSYVLTACPSAFPIDTLSLASLSFELDGLSPPTTAGEFRWHAVVSPQAAAPYELQAILPLPQAVTMRVRYEKTHKRAVVTGRVTQRGRAVAGADVTIVAHYGANRSVGFADTRTNAKGLFTRAVPIRGTTNFTASIAQTTRPCAAPLDPATACLGETTIPPAPGSATLWMSVATGAVRAIRAADQRRADRLALTVSDLPPGADAGPASGSDCLNQKHESTLRITGESTSRTFAQFERGNPPAGFQAQGLTRIYATPRQARAAYLHEARLQTARCVTKGSLGDDGFALGVLRLPRLPVAARAFRATLSAEGLTLAYDVIFLQRGRVVTTLQFALLNVPASSETDAVAAVARRMAATR